MFILNDELIYKNKIPSINLIQLPLFKSYKLFEK